jgi:hypothetical protein
MTQEALKLALEALKMADELCRGHGVDFKEYGLEFDRDIQVKYKDAITAIKEALAHCPDCGQLLGDAGHIHTCSPQRTWVGLTDDEIIDVIHPLVMADMPDQATDYEIAKAIEAKLKEKNT